MLRSFWHFNRITFFLLDYALLWLAGVCAFKLSPRYVNDILTGPWLIPELRFIGYGMPLCMAVGLQVTGLQRVRAGFRPMETLASTGAGIASGMLAFMVVHAVVEFSLVGRYILLFTLVYGTAFVAGSRMLVWNLAEQQIRKVVVYGSEAASHLLARALASAQLPIRVVGWMDDARAGQGLAIESTLRDRCAVLGAREMVVEVSDALSAREREALLHCTGAGIAVVDMGYFFEREFEKVYVRGLREAWFWGYDPAYVHPVYFVAKRAIDVAVSLLGLLAAAPLVPAVLLAIRLQDGGPALYSQMRVGLNSRPFRIYKVRTMRLDAERNGPQWAQANDERTTRLGRFLRCTRLDEVPQFWNILRGDMSFIGPRPERPELVEKIEREVPFYRYRHLIKPGLTGWAQVNYPYGASVEDARQKLAYDLYYLKYGTLTREMTILLSTVVAMVRGAR